PEPWVGIPRDGPAQEARAEHEPRVTVEQDESAVGERVERCIVMALPARVCDALGVELRVDRIGSDLAGVQLPPQRAEAVVVLAAAERAGAVAGREGGRLVEEEELREAAGLQERLTVPPLELEAAGDPTLAVEAPPDAPGVVVEAAAIAVDEAPGGVGDELAERRDPVW